MLSTLALLVLAIASHLVISSPVHTPAPKCTKTVYKNPSLERHCTFKHHTHTHTHFVNCSGCALETKVLGLGLPCLKHTTEPGTATVTVEACAHSKTKSPTTATTTKKHASKREADAPQQIYMPPSSACCESYHYPTGPTSSATCTMYGEVVTKTVSEDCGPMATERVFSPDRPAQHYNALRPLVQCGTWTSAATGTKTVTLCAAGAVRTGASTL